MVNIALLGYGTIGSGFYEILEKNKAKIENLVKARVNIKYILVEDLEKEREEIKDKGILTDDYCRILDDSELDIIVELMSGKDGAFDYIKDFLKKGTTVITANKEVLAKNYTELMELAEKNNTHLFFEASVAGGIPIIKAIKEYLTGDNIFEIDAILNGTTNYILSVMEEKTISMKETLKLAQEKGISEENPSADLEGHDAANKISILANLAFDISVNPEDIPCRGVEGITSYDIIYAAELGYKIKLIASIKNIDNNINIGVRPNLVEKNEYLASIDGVDNAVEIFSQYSGRLRFDGKGAGKYPTGNAVISDLIEAVKVIKKKKVKFEVNKLEKIETFDLHANLEQPFYIRLQIEKDEEIIEEVKKKFSEEDIADLFFKDNMTETPILPVIIITKKIKERRLENILEDIDEIDGVLTINNIIPIREKVK